MFMPFWGKPYSMAVATVEDFDDEGREREHKILLTYFKTVSINNKCR